MEEQNKKNANGQMQQNQSEEYVFYNVMPKDKTSDKIVGPKMAISAPEKTAVQITGLKSFFIANKKIIFTILAVLILAGIGYFIYVNYFIGPSGNDIAALTAPVNKQKKQSPPEIQN